MKPFCFRENEWNEEFFEYVWEEQQEKGDAAVENRFTLAGLKPSGPMSHGP